jgi:O-antigen ligase
MDAHLMIKKLPDQNITSDRHRRDLAPIAKLTAWTMALAIFGYPIAAMTSTFAGINDDYLSILSRVFVVAVAGLLFLRILPVAKLQPVDGLVALFIVAYLFRLVWDGWIGQVAGAWPALLFFSVSVIAPGVVIAITARQWNDQEVARTILSIGFILCVGALTLQALGRDLGAENESYTNRLSLDRLNPITIGHIGCTTALAALIRWKTALTNGKRAIVLLAAGSGLITLFLAGSRGPLVSFIVCLTAYVLARKKPAHFQLILVGLYICIIIYALNGFDQIIATAAESLRLDGAGTDASSNERLVSYAEAVEEYLKYPILGSAYALPLTGEYPHNLFLETGLALGTLGLGIISLLTIRTISATVSALEGNKGMAAFVFLQAFVAAQFSGGIWGNTALWIGMAIVLALRTIEIDCTRSIAAGGHPDHSDIQRNFFVRRP